MGFNWSCPYCFSKTTINSDKTSKSEHKLFIENAEGLRILISQFIICPNEECRRITLLINLHEYKLIEKNWKIEELIKSWQLLPTSYAKTFPDYIPEPLRNDYEEAMAILELSPKASATLSRRCLQGIIRDF